MYCMRYAVVLSIAGFKNDPILTVYIYWSGRYLNGHHNMGLR